MKCGLNITCIETIIDFSEAPIVWLHDYHLMLAANTIRDTCVEEEISIKMSFFLHIPFPSWDIMRIFPWSDEILQGMLGCDMVGFHTEDYCLNFLDCAQRCLGCRVDRTNMLVEHCGRTVRVKAMPIGIPYDRWLINVFSETANFKEMSMSICPFINIYL